MNKIRVYCTECGWLGKNTYTSICAYCGNDTRKTSDYMLCEKHTDCENFEIGKMSIELRKYKASPFYILYCKKQDSGCDRKKLYRSRSILPMRKSRIRKPEKQQSL